MEDDELLKKLRRKIHTYFYILLIGMVLSFSSMVALQTLQTSINIEGNVGAIALTSAYLGSVLYSIFVAPITMRRFGPGLNLVLSDLSYFIYCISNFYPEIYILVPGAIISCVARAMLLPSTAIACFQLAEQFYRCASQSEEMYINRFQSRYVGIFSTVSIIGNGISFAVLSGGQSSSSPTTGPDVTPGPLNTTVFWGTTTSSPFVNHSQYYYCGKNDCQDPAVVSESIDQYVPPDKRSTYILVSTASAICVIAVIMHAFIYPGIGKFGNKLRDLDKQTSQIVKPKKTSKGTKVPGEGSEVKENGHLSGETNTQTNGTVKAGQDNFTFEPDMENNNKLDDSEQNTKNSSNYRSKSELSEEDIQENLSKTKNQDGYLTTLKKTGKFLIRPQAILIGFTPIRNGLLIGFIFADVTRAYASCVAGVQMTGLIALTFGTVGIPIALAYGSLVKYTGRNVMMAIGALFELLAYIGCYVWIPNPDTIVVVFCIFIADGIVNTILKINITVVYDEYFPGESHISVNVWNFWMQGAVGLQYALSTFMCMVDKIYLGVAFLFVSVFFYAIAEIRHSAKKRAKEEEKKQEDEPQASSTKL
uniref:protein unc-93 homolog A-like n=1 Tax=Styela clava TaxID=7725 RepID=UPI001939808D|nr:protein unc-93 homolog A-like [Styela clava]